MLYTLLIWLTNAQRYKFLTANALCCRHVVFTQRKAGPAASAGWVLSQTDGLRIAGEQGNGNALRDLGVSLLGKTR